MLLEYVYILEPIKKLLEYFENFTSILTEVFPDYFEAFIETWAIALELFWKLTTHPST